MGAEHAIEEWRPVKGYEGYEVSSFGAVRSWKPLRNNAPIPNEPRKLRLQEDKDGYRKVVLYKDKRRKDFRVSALVCAAWHGERHSIMEVRHLDGNNQNDTPANLKWGTADENAKDRKRHGTQINGEMINTAKLTAEIVREIRRSSESVQVLAERFGVTIGAVHHARRKHTWKHI